MSGDEERIVGARGADRFPAHEQRPRSVLEVGVAPAESGVDARKRYNIMLYADNTVAVNCAIFFLEHFVLFDKK